MSASGLARHQSRIWDVVAPLLLSTGKRSTPAATIRRNISTQHSPSDLLYNSPLRARWSGPRFSRPQSHSQQKTKFSLSRSFASGTLLAFVDFSPTAISNEVKSACSNGLDGKLCALATGKGQIRAFSSSRVLSLRDTRRRFTRQSVSGKPTKGETKPPEQPKEPLAGNATEKPKETESLGHLSLFNRLPHIHRPTKEELLAVATGFWERLRIRFKWFSIRSFRPWNTDDWSAFFTWFLAWQVLWVLLGTTTFFSLAILTVNTVFAQETLARWVGNYLTQSSGVKVVFESAIVPKWENGVITFKNVFISRRPGEKAKVSKGSPATAAAAAAAAAKAKLGPAEGGDDDGNYTQFDVTIDTVNVTLSFYKWMNGKGLLSNVEIHGVRGVIDRSFVHPTGEWVDPASFRHSRNPGDFELDYFKLEDLLVTVLQPRGFRPFPVSIFSCELPRLRKQWLFYDFLSANNVSGSYDESLFTIHPRQSLAPGGEELLQDAATGPQRFKKHSRCRLDGLPIAHLNHGGEAPFSWIQEGNVDIVADLLLPEDNDESIVKVMSDVYERMEATVTAKAGEGLDDEAVISAKGEDKKRFVVFDLRIHLNDVRAAVPLFNKDLGYVNSALIRPIVAYINSRRTYIPIKCRVVKPASDFDGSWTTYDSGLLDDMAAETYEAFAANVLDEQARRRRIRRVGLWSLQLAMQAIFLGMAGNVA